MKRGTTLIEVMIIFMILGILAAMLIPALKRAKESADRNHAEIEAKKEAVRKKNPPIFACGDIVYLKMGNKKAMVLETRFDDEKCIVIYIVRVDGIESPVERREIELSAEAEHSFNY
jgi:CDP-diacylglycerol pyrophosphatase